MRRLILLLTFSFFTIYANAQGLSPNGNGTYSLTGQDLDLLELIKDYGKLTKTNVFISNEVKNKHFSINFYGNKNIDKEKLDRLIISLATSHSLTVIRSKDKKELNIFSLRSAKYETLPHYKEAKNVPKTKEFVSYFYKVKHLSPKIITRSFRAFLSKIGRIYADSNSKGITIRGYGVNVHFLNDLISMVDTPEMANSIKSQKAFNKELKELAKSKPPISERIEKHLYLFIILFSLIALIIGFMFRGFVIRRIEGGL